MKSLGRLGPEPRQAGWRYSVPPRPSRLAPCDERLCWNRYTCPLAAGTLRVVRFHPAGHFHVSPGKMPKRRPRSPRTRAHEDPVMHEDPSIALARLPARNSPQARE